MAKEKLTGWLHEPLTAVLGTRGKVAVLRTLWRAATAIPYREVVRRSGMAYRSIDLALGELTRAGVVEELVGGRERRVMLSTRHRLAAAIAAVMQVDADFFPSLRVELRTVAEGCRRHGLVSAAIIGAAAQRKELLGGALEVVVLVADVAGVARCRAAFDAAGEGVAVRFGAPLRVMVYDVAAARTMWHTRTPTAERNVREAELLAGTPLVVLLSE